MSVAFDTDRFRQKLKSKYIGKKIVYTDVTGSTMDDARRFGVNDPSQYPHGTLIMAERQTKARGARDHKWDASNTGNIYVSIILHLPQNYKTFEGRFGVEVAACLAVFDVVRILGVEAIPKWPNDLWLRGHKLAGFLVEDGRFDIPGSNSCLIILGMGINVNADIRRNAELYSIAASLMCERNGRQVCREEFLSDVCLALEESLVSRTSNLLKYRTHNLFQKGCPISVTCSPENRVINGEFLEVGDNWEIKFMDKRTGEILSGRSDYFSIRCKVQRKILVVFTGLTSSRSAAVVASKLTSIIDTTKWVVCSVPETAVTQADEWMKSCDLLVLTEDVCDSVRLTSKLTQFLKKGGNLLTTGIASYFTAKIFEIPFKEGVLQSMGSNTNVSVISVEYNDENEDEINNVIDSDHDEHCEHCLSSTCSSHVTFPTSLVYFKFHQDYSMKGSSCTTSQSPRTENPLSSLTLRSNDLDSDSESHISLCSDKNMSLRYYSLGNDESKDVCCIAIMTKATSYGGSIAVFGFDLGHNSLPLDKSTSSSPSSSSMAAAGQDEMCKDNEKKDKSVKGTLTGFEKIVEVVEKDRFKRDKLIYQVLNILNIT